MTFGRGAVLCWQLVHSVALIAYCGCGRGADWGDQSTWLRGMGVWWVWKSGRLIALIVQLLWDFVQGRPGRPVDLVTGNGGLMGFENQGDWSLWLYNFYGILCKADRGDQSTWLRGMEVWWVLKIRAIGRSDLYNFMGFCKADRGDQSTWFMRDNFETFKTWNFEIWFDCQGDRGGWLLWFLKCSLVALNWVYGYRQGVTCSLGEWPWVPTRAIDVHGRGAGWTYFRVKQSIWSRKVVKKRP